MALAKVPSNLFGIVLVTVDPQVYTVGDIDAFFSIQSISKVVTLAKVFQQSGEQVVEDTIGVDATGQVFNSIVAVEQYKGQEINSFVNPGAIATTSMVKGPTRRRSGPRSSACTAPSPGASWRCAGQVRYRRLLAAARRGRQQRAGAEGDRRHLRCARRQPLRRDAAMTARTVAPAWGTFAAAVVDFGRCRTSI